MTRNCWLLWEIISIFSYKKFNWLLMVIYFRHTVCVMYSQSICFLWSYLRVLWPIKSNLKSYARLNSPGIKDQNFFKLEKKIRKCKYKEFRCKCFPICIIWFLLNVLSQSLKRSYKFSNYLESCYQILNFEN